MSTKAMLCAVEDHLRDALDQLKEKLPPTRVVTSAFPDAQSWNNAVHRILGFERQWRQFTPKDNAAYWVEDFDRVQDAYGWPELACLETLLARIRRYQEAVDG